MKNTKKMTKETKAELREKAENLEKKTLFLQEMITSKDSKIDELRKRAESYKAQVIVYKSLYDKVLNKLIYKDNGKKF